MMIMMIITITITIIVKERMQLVIAAFRGALKKLNSLSNLRTA